MGYDFYRAWVGVVLLGSLGTAIAGCSLFPAAPSNVTPVTTPATDLAPAAPSPTEWQTLVPGETTADLTFTASAELALQDKILLPSIPVSYDGDSTPATYAARLLLSPPSPAGRYTIVKACEDPNPGMGLCWSIYQVDRQSQTAQKVSIGKYGGLDWVQWSPDERYAVFLEKLEGSAWFIVLDLESGTAAMMEEISPSVDLAQFQWTGDRTFSVPLGDGSSFIADINTLAFRP